MASYTSNEKTPQGYALGPVAYASGPGGYTPGPGGYTPGAGGYTPGPGGYTPGSGTYPPAPGGYPPPPQGVLYTPNSPITNQPMGGNIPQIQWMEKPQTIPTNCPPGLEYLTTIDQLLINQQMDVMEIMTNMEMENRYIVFNTLGQQIYFAQEQSNAFNRDAAGASRSFDMKVIDNFGNMVIHMKRSGCSCCCCPCCLNNLKVSAPPGVLAGTIEEQWSFFYPSFHIKNDAGETVLRMSGPCCASGCCSDVEFKVLSADGSTEVGKISKKFDGHVSGPYMNRADNFGISFPVDLDVRMKAVMLGACLLIDYMYFEQQPNQNKQNERNNRNRLGGH